MYLIYGSNWLHWYGSLFLFFGVGQWLDWKVIHKMILINQNKRIISKWKSTALSCIIYEHTVA